MMIIWLGLLACLIVINAPLLTNQLRLSRHDALIMLMISIVLVLMTIGYLVQSKNYKKTAKSVEVVQSLIQRSHLESIVKNQSDEQKTAFCTEMQRYFHRELKSEWLNNIASCFLHIDTATAKDHAQSILQFGLTLHPNDIGLSIMHAQRTLANFGIQSLEFRSELSHLLAIAPTHRTTLWFAAAEAYYRGERNQALAYLVQLREKVGDEKEILEFIGAVKNLPVID